LNRPPRKHVLKRKKVAFGAVSWDGWGEAQKEAQEGQKHNSKQARSTILLSFCKLEYPKRARSTRLLAFLQLSIPKQARTYDTLAFFKFLLNKKRPEHETVGLFATFHGKEGPDLRYSRNF